MKKNIFTIALAMAFMSTSVFAQNMDKKEEKKGDKMMKKEHKMEKKDSEGKMKKMEKKEDKMTK